jgi:hypothetical protein
MTTKMQLIPNHVSLNPFVLCKDTSTEMLFLEDGFAAAATLDFD